MLMFFVYQMRVLCATQQDCYLFAHEPIALHNTEPSYCANDAFITSNPGQLSLAEQNSEFEQYDEYFYSGSTFMGNGNPLLADTMLSAIDDFPLKNIKTEIVEMDAENLYDMHSYADNNEDAVVEGDGPIYTDLSTFTGQGIHEWQIQTNECQDYYTKLLRVHILVNRLLEYPNAWELISDKMKEDIYSLLSLRHSICPTYMCDVNSVSAVFSILFLPRSFCDMAVYEGEDTSKVVENNRNLIIETFKYAKHANYNIDIVRVHKIIYNFMLNELIMTIRQDVSYSVSQLFNPARSDCADNIESLLAAYSFAYYCTKVIKEPIVMDNFAFFAAKFSLDIEPKTITKCKICHLPLTSNVFVVDNALLRFTYCNEHRELNKIQPLMFQRPENVSYNSLAMSFYTKIDFFDGVFLPEFERISSDREISFDILYYKKMMDFCRYLIIDSKERKNILGRIQKTVETLPNLQFEPSMLLVAIMEFEMQQTTFDSKFQLDNFYASYIANEKIIVHESSVDEYGTESVISNTEILVELAKCIEEMKKLENH